MTELVFVTPVEVDRPVDGLRWRAHLTARALAELGELRIVEVTTDRGRHGVDVVVTPRTPVRRVLSRAHPSLPARVAARDWRPAGQALGAIAGADLIWVMQPDLVGAGVTLPAGPLVVDLVDLEDGKFSDRSRAERHQRDRWARLQASVIDRADAVVVANPGEAATIGHPRARVLPNAVDVAEVDRVDGTTALTLVGRFTYQPNLEAAEWMVGEVLPRIRARRPDAELLLVGRHDGALDHLDAVDGVQVCGFVADLDSTWRRTAAMVAPIRTGTGTRLKIIESFGRAVPVVSTRLGCDGLDVVAGRDLLVADAPDEFADACLDLLGDPAHGTRLVDQARRLFRRDHAPAVFAAAVSAVVAEAMAAHR